MQVGRPGPFQTMNADQQSSTAGWLGHLDNFCKPSCAGIAVSILQDACVGDFLLRVQEHMWCDALTRAL